MQEITPEQASGFLRPIVSELRHNARVAGPALWLDSSILVVCAVLFFLCDNVLIGAVADKYPDSAASYLLSCHAIDAIGGCAFMAYTNLLLDLVKPDMRFKRVVSTLVYMLFCGVFWEAIAPSFVPNSTGDVLDVVAYLVGACCYLLLAKAFLHKAREDVSNVGRRGIS